MKKVHIVIMGKTGAGKSTLVNAILGEKKAPVNIGESGTKENHEYIMANNGYEYHLYDTVGLEIDETITQTTLTKIKQHIYHTQKKSNSTDIHVVWFCVNYRSDRFEKYEIQLIKQLSIEYMIPFILVFTQCVQDGSELENVVKTELPDITQMKVLAEDYKIRGGVIPAYGVNELIEESITNYKELKVELIEKKIDQLNVDKKIKIDSFKSKASDIIKKYSDKGLKTGIIPMLCIPKAHILCVKMCKQLDVASGIEAISGMSDEKFTDAVVGLIATPFMAVPFISPFAVSSYIETVGTSYQDALVTIIERLSHEELKDVSKIKDTIKSEMSKNIRG